MESERGDGAAENPVVTLGILEALDRGQQVSQRSMARELNVALGLVNAYLHRCVKKGLVKVQQAPKGRFAYYLTPKGFAEKSRLSASYFAHSFAFFRRARHDCEEALTNTALSGFRKAVLAGATDLAEIAAICALDGPVVLVGVYDAAGAHTRVAGLPVFIDIEAARLAAEVAILTETRTTAAAYAEAVSAFGADRVIVPAMLEPAVGVPNPNGRIAP